MVNCAASGDTWASLFYFYIPSYFQELHTVSSMTDSNCLCIMYVSSFMHSQSNCFDLSSMKRTLKRTKKSTSLPIPISESASSTWNIMSQSYPLYWWETHCQTNGWRGKFLRCSGTDTNLYDMKCHLMFGTTNYFPHQGHIQQSNNITCEYLLVYSK